MSGRYRKLDTSVWADARFLSLSKPQPNARDLYIYLLAGPRTTNLPGLVRTGVGGLSEELEWDPDATARVFQEVVDLGLAKFDQSTRLVYVPDAIGYNLPESPNVVLGWKHTWAEIPDSALKREAESDFARLLTEYGKGDSYINAFLEVTGKSTGKTNRKTNRKTRSVSE